MSASFIASLNFATARTYVWFGTPLIIGGVLGNILNTITFLSLNIYRESSTAFYLTVVSVVNIGQLLTGLLSYVLVNATGIDWMESSVIFCKARSTIFQACAIISPMCLCLVTIDQFLATSPRPQWQQWSNIRTAHRLSLICIVFWLVYGIPYILYYSPNEASASRLASCAIQNAAYLKYYTHVHSLVMMCAVPLFLTIVFGLLAYHNVRHSAHRMIPLIRRRHETQLTTMVLVQIIFNAFATPSVFVTRTTASYFTPINTSPVIAAQLRFAIAVTTCVYYLYYAIPFYIYICVSERFRKQLRYVIVDIHLNRCGGTRRNDVAPEMPLPSMKQIQHIVVDDVELA